MKKTIAYIVVIVLALCFTLPFIIMILGSLKVVERAQMDPMFWLY